MRTLDYYKPLVQKNSMKRDYYTLGIIIGILVTLVVLGVLKSLEMQYQHGWEAGAAHMNKAWLLMEEE